MNHATPTPPVSLSMSCDSWLRLSMIMFGVMDAQNVCCRRLLSYEEMNRLTKVGGKMSLFMIYTPMHSWIHNRVLLSAADVAVILKAVTWYEDNLIATGRAIEQKYGENELTNRYEALTKLTRAIQTAPQVTSDQRDR